MSKTTTIAVNKTTAKRLQKIGKMGQTYDDLINELLDDRGVEW